MMALAIKSADERYQNKIDEMIRSFFRKPEVSIIIAFMGPLGKVRNTSSVLNRKALHVEIKKNQYQSHVIALSLGYFDEMVETINEEIEKHYMSKLRKINISRMLL